MIEFGFLFLVLLLFCDIERWNLKWNRYLGNYILNISFVLEVIG